MNDWQWEIRISGVHDWGEDTRATMDVELVTWKMDGTTPPPLPRSGQRFYLVEVTDE